MKLFGSKENIKHQYLLRVYNEDNLLLSESTKKHKRNLLLLSYVMLCLIFVGTEMKFSSVLGMKLADDTFIETISIQRILFFVLLYELVMFFMGQREDSSKIEKDNADLSAQIDIKYYDINPKTDSSGIPSLNIYQDDLQLNTEKNKEILINIENMLAKHQEIWTAASDIAPKLQYLYEGKDKGSCEMRHAFTLVNRLKTSMDKQNNLYNYELTNMFNMLKADHLQAKIEKLDKKISEGITQINSRYLDNIKTTKDLIAILNTRSLDDKLNKSINIIFPLLFGLFVLLISFFLIFPYVFPSLSFYLFFLLT